MSQRLILDLLFIISYVLSRSIFVMAIIEEDKDQLRAEVQASNIWYMYNETITINNSHQCGACALMSCWYSNGECLTMFPKAPVRESTKKVSNSDETFH